MAIFHVTLKHGSRKDGRLGVDKFDYINRLGRFAKRHDGALGYSENGNLPAWAITGPRDFWTAADAAERANGNIYHELEFALPVELTLPQQIEAAREFARLICGAEHPFSMGLHDKKGNPHVHLMWSGRQLDGIEREAEKFFRRYNPKQPERGGCAKADTAGNNWLVDRRRDWQDVANRHLATAGVDARIDHRSHKTRGLEETPGVHLGRRVTRLEQRGKSTWRGIKNREAAYLNSSLREVRSRIKEKEHGQQRFGRDGKPHHHRRRAGAPAAPQRAFTTWRDRSENSQGLRTSRRAGPERMPTLRQPSAGDGLQETSNALLQRTVQRSGGGNHGLHGLHIGGIYCIESLDRRQQYKRQILSERYKNAISDQLASRLLYVDRQMDQIVITLRGFRGAVAGRVIDKGDRLSAGRRGTKAEIDTLIDLAKAKGWKQINLSGADDFKARAWLEASRAGLSVVGYEPAAEIRAQLQKEKAMLGQAGAGGMMALTPDVSAAQISPATRWLDALRTAREKLEAERKTAREKLAELKETDLKELQKELAAAHGGAVYSEALQKFKTTAAAVKAAGVLGRKRAEAKKEQAWQAFLVLHNQALTVPLVAEQVADAARQNQEREQLVSRLSPVARGIEQIKFLETEIANGKNPEPEFKEAWRLRKMQPLKPWQELALAPVFEADAARERARLTAETEATAQVKQGQRQEQIQKEIWAQQQADAIQEQLDQPGLPSFKQDALELQQRYYQALADGHDEEDAKEYAAKKADAPRPG